MVAPIRVSSPSSTAGSRASCWALLKRWISSRKRIVGPPVGPAALPRALDHRADLRPAGVDGRLLLEGALRARRRDPRQRRLPGARRPVEDRAVGPAALDRHPQRRPRAEHVLLPDQLDPAAAAASAPPAARPSGPARAPDRLTIRRRGSPVSNSVRRSLRLSMREPGEPSTEPPGQLLRRGLPGSPLRRLESTVWPQQRHAPPLPPSSRSTPPPASSSARSRRSPRTRSRGWSTTSPGSSPPGPSSR